MEWTTLVVVLTTADSRGYQPGNSYVCDGLLARLLWGSPERLVELDITAGLLKELCELVSTHELERRPGVKTFKRVI